MKSTNIRSHSRFNLLAVQFALFFLSSCGGGGSEQVASPSTGSTPVAAGFCTSVKYDAPSGAASNITFVFDKQYRCGQFANGDWWVSEDSSGGVVITAITPTADGGKNGFEVNPTRTRAQAFDNSADTPYDANLMPALPMRLSGVSSVIKGVSIAGSARPQLRFAAVLTIVDAPIDNSSEVFRPGYFGSIKTFYSLNSIDVAGIPKYNAAGLSAVPELTFSTIANRYRHVQIDHISSWTGRDIHPADNMPDYGADIATNSAVSLLRILLNDFNYSDPVHKQALVNYLQMAIDLQAMAVGGSTWNADGGHMNGRKLPLIFAARVLNNADFTNAVAASVFSEDEQVWRSGSGIALFGRPGTESGYWATTRGLAGAKDIRDPYGYVDGGGYELGDGYQFCCTFNPWKYAVLATYMLGLESAWGNDRILIDYVERWETSGAKALPDPCAPYDGNPANYGITYGPDGAGGCILGSGRWPGKNGINAGNGFYGSNLGNQLWTWFKSQP